MKQEDYISILRDVMRIESVNGNEKLVAEYYKKLLQKHGISSTIIDYNDKRANLVAEITHGEGPVLALSGHLDVVSAGDKSKWRFEPFSGHIEDGVIWGRGASDMKGGLTALVLAFIELSKSKQFTGTVRLLATVGEEIGQYGSKLLADKGYVDDVDAMIIGEPCNLAVMYAHKGSLNYKLISEGIAAHSSTPELGSNAIEHLNTAISMISKRIEEKATACPNAVLGTTFHNVTIISGGSQVNSLPDSAYFEANVRTVPEFNNSDVINEVREILEELNRQEGVNLTLEVTADHSPVEANSKSRLINTIIDVVENVPHLNPQYLIQKMGELLGEDLLKMDPSLETLDSLIPIAVSGTTDAAEFMKVNPEMELAVYGPGMPMLNHKINERLPLSQYLDFIDVYQSIMKSYLRSKTD
ncbi:ArgE/DapE family deacylase [Streptococcus pluranimalium]|uniref:ArgE/DapE family deacylase n=1 Tax=Streptococcus pluranimalium TaxID=82348 RepID=UPI003F68FCAD